MTPSIADLAEQLGEEPDWLQRKLHGQTAADLGDVMGWALHYAVHILPVFDNSADLLFQQQCETGDTVCGPFWPLHTLHVE